MAALALVMVVALGFGSGLLAGGTGGPTPRATSVAILESGSPGPTGAGNPPDAAETPADDPVADPSPTGVAID
ncbi:MAG: hypothetical protein MUQ32_18555, partial [Chloroflexi bacterium]|nr:hypothetical protein [Chloroflexota bacterium]